MLPHLGLVSAYGELSFTSSGMMLCLVPPWIEPTVTTAGSVGFISRLTMVCSARMNCGGDHDRIVRRVRIAPWPPRPPW